MHTFVFDTNVQFISLQLLSDATTGGTWSSSPTANATVGTSTGIVTGVATGIATILYTLPAGCYVPYNVTVSASPAAITGSLNVCVEDVATLSDATTGGTWSSSNTAVGINPATGDYSGALACTSTITYTLPAGCPANTMVTIDSLPGPIMPGITAFCYGTPPPTFSDAITSGTWSWSSSDEDVATVDPVSGVVTALPPGGGTTTITYTLVNACGSYYTDFDLQIDTLVIPALITGPSAICAGSPPVTLGEATTGGMWTSAHPTIAAIGASSGTVTGLSAGTDTIYYYVANSCGPSPYGSQLSLTVEALPPTTTHISGPASVCVGSFTTYSFTRIGSGGDFAWESSDPTVATVTLLGEVTAITPGTFTLIYTLTNLCGTFYTNKTITVTSLSPAITGTPEVCPGLTTTLGETLTGGTWTTSSAIATVGSGTGIVTGITNGIAIITFTAHTGCWGTEMVTVNPSPPAIMGGPVVCIGTPVSLTNSSSRGTWSSSATATATVGSTGLVTGVAPGTASITYTLPTGCPAVLTITVNAAPAAITGTVNVCAGQTTTLSDLSTGGIWSSSPTATATVGSATGIVTGVAADTATIIYTLPTGCSIPQAITVSPSPAPLTGSGNVCIGQTTVLTDATTGGTWSSSLTATAMVSVGIGIVTGVAVGTATIIYTLPTGCAISQSVTVNPLPAAITGTVNVCIGQTTVLTDATTGGTWSSSLTATATVSAGTGIATGVAAGSVTIVYTLPTGCAINSTITVNPLPAAITGAANVCPGREITLSDATTGGTWSSGATGMATVSTGIVSGIAAGAAAITYTLPTGCTTVHAITVNPLPAPITGAGSVCAGQTVALSDATTGGSWSSGATTIATIGTGIVTGIVAGTSLITYTSSAGCITTFAETVNALPVVAASFTPTSCGGNDVLTATGGVVYSWLPATGLSCATCAVTDIIPVASAAYTITATSAAGCTDTASVSLDGNRISGYITFSAAPPDTLDMKAWLIQFNPVDSSLNALDSTLTCLSGGTPYYEFDNEPAGNYMVKAALLHGNTPGGSGYIPTYGLQSPYWDTAVTISHSAASDTLHIIMQYGIVPPGPGFISGSVISGADRGTNTGVPVPGMMICLKDATTNLVITYTYTDADGLYAFPGIAYGAYNVYPEDYDYTTTPSINITLSSANASDTNVDFKQHTLSKTITPYTTPADVHTVSANATLEVFPNPTTGNLNIAWQNQTTGDAAIIMTDMLGREVYKNTININTAAGQTQLYLLGLKDGIYLLTIRNGYILYNSKLTLLR